MQGKWNAHLISTAIVITLISQTVITETDTKSIFPRIRKITEWNRLNILVSFLSFSGLDRSYRSEYKQVFLASEELRIDDNGKAQICEG